VNGVIVEGPAAAHDGGMRLVHALLLLVAVGCGEDPMVSIPAGSAAQVLGRGTCESLPLPERCFRHESTGSEFEAACLVGSEGQIKSTDAGESVFTNGCVGALVVLRAGVAPSIDDPRRFGMWVAPGQCSSMGPDCFPEWEPSNQRATIVSFHPGSRALFVRSAEPVTGPARVSGFITTFKPLPENVVAGWMYRLFVDSSAR
jgi:hypothetical protein